MCGLTFQHDAALSRDALATRARGAIARIAYRGPDAFGDAGGDGWHMGHARLAIIGLGDGDQPMADPDGRWTIVYNGEIYNYIELREWLAPRWRFRTQCDTEVVLAGLILDGAEFLRRLNGMWALALWDAAERRLLLSRDRLGKKPLYLRHDGQRLACASELGALRVLVPGSTRIDEDSLADILRYGAPLPGHTIEQGVGEVLPGHVLHWTPGSDARQQPFWSLPDSPAPQPRGESGERVMDLLTSAVKYRLVADVEVGAFLSGGLDSSLVSAIAARHAGRRLRTFSIGFPDASFDESDYARRMAEFLGTEHESAIYRGSDRAEMRRLVVDHVGMPFGDASLLPTAAVSALAATRVKVALSGDGADELFGGYQRYLGRALLRWYSRLPAPLQRGAEGLLRRLPEPLHHHSRSLVKKAQLFARSARLAREGGDAYVAPRLLSDIEIAAIAPGLARRGHRPPQLPERVAGDDLLRMMCADALVYLPQDILVKTDRASMAHSLEQRCPFLDYRLVELALSRDSRDHFRGLRGKALLRRSAAELTPPWLWRRRKQGFAVPLGAWFRGDLGDDLVQTLAESDQHWIDPAVVRALLDEHRGGAVDHGQRLWLLWTVATWVAAMRRPESPVRDGDAAVRVVA